MFKLHFAETQVILKVLFSVKLKGTSHTKQIKNHLIFVHADLFFHFRYFFQMCIRDRVYDLRYLFKKIYSCSTHQMQTGISNNLFYVSRETFIYQQY